MIKEFIPYEQALELKELGFDDPCFRTGWDFDINFNNIRMPTFSQAFRWFREKYNFIIEIRNWSGKNQNQWYYMIHRNNQLIPWQWDEKSYEEVELECLIKLIEIVKQK